MATDQRPVELILARGLMSNLATPAFLVDPHGTLVFFNDAAGELLGLRYEEAGPMKARDWGTRFDPHDDGGREIPLEELPLVIALETGHPAHRRFTIRAATGEERHIEASAFPIVGNGGMRGAMAIFWEAAG